MRPTRAGPPGAIMIAIGVTDVAGGDQQAAYAVGVRWKTAHFMPMHGVLVLPLLAWLLSRTALPEPARLHTVRLAAAGYGVLCALALAESIAATNPLHAPLVADVIAVAGAALIAAAALRTLRAGPSTAGAESPGRRSYLGW